jgi:hypothetical protein
MYHLQIAILMSDAQEVFFQNLTARHCHAKFAHRSHPCIPFIPTGLYGPQQDVRSFAHPWGSTHKSQADSDI